MLVPRTIFENRNFRGIYNLLKIGFLAYIAKIINYLLRSIKLRNIANNFIM